MQTALPPGKHKTENNYDLLRIVCTFAVIIIHVSQLYKDAYTDANAPYKVHIVTTLICNTLSRFAVPCFMMLSGAFLLDNDKNQNYKFFYKKSFVKIGIPTIIFSVFYFIYSLLIAFANFWLKGGKITILLDPIKSAVKGEPFYHMWYLYTLIGIYFLIPVLIKIKLDIGEKYFAKLSWVYLILATISGFTSSSILQWSLSQVVVYLGFVLVGYQIRVSIREKKNNIKGLMFIILSMIVFLFLTYIQYGHTISGLSKNDEKYSIVGSFNPLVVLSSILIFYGFSYLSIKSDRLKKLSKDTFLIYLFHAGVWNLLNRIFFKLIGTKTDPVFTIPIAVFITFIISWILTIIYNKAWNRLNKNDRLSDRLCALLHL